MPRSAWVTRLALLAVLGCGRRQAAASPLAALGSVTRAELSIWAPSHIDPSSVTIRDPATLAQLRALAMAPGDWAPIRFSTEPNGDVRAALYRDTTYLGVVSLGEEWVGARGPTGGAKYRAMTPPERPVLAAIRAAQ